MKMVISDYKLVAGLIDSDYRSRIERELKEKGKAKILIDYWIDGQSTPGQVTPFPFKISTQSLVKNNRTIQLISRYESGPKAIFRITKIEIVIKGYKTPGHKRFFELTLEKPLIIRKKKKNK